MGARFRAVATAIAILLPAVPAMARPPHPIFCDDLRSPTCRPPNEMAGVWPRCFCSVPAVTPAPRRASARRTAPSCLDRCATADRACQRAARTCDRQICDEDGFAAEQAAVEACFTEFAACRSSCTP